MDAYTSHVLLLWDIRFKSLEKSLKDLNRLPSADKRNAALTLRNACFDALDQYGESLERMRVDFTGLQDAKYEERLDEIKLSPQPNEIRYFASSSEIRACEVRQIKELTTRMLCESANHEAELAKHQRVVTALMNAIFQKLQNQYGIPLKRISRK